MERGERNRSMPNFVMQGLLVIHLCTYVVGRWPPSYISLDGGSIAPA